MNATSELRYLLLTAILTGCLWIPVVIGYLKTRGPLAPEGYVVAPTTPLPAWVNRAGRAHANAVESFAPFAALVLTGHALGASDGVTAGSAAAFFWARLAHAVIHISGFSRLRARTVIFALGWAAFMVFAADLALRVF